MELSCRDRTSRISIAEENFWLVAPPGTKVPIADVDLTGLEQWILTQPLIAYSEELPIIRRFW